MHDSNVESTSVQASLETRLIFINAESGTVNRAAAQLQDWLNEGFEIVCEETKDGHLYIRLERDNAAIEEAARWAALSEAERIVENLQSWNRVAGGAE